MPLSQEFQDMEREVQETIGVAASAGALIDAFGAYVLAHANDPAALRQYVQDLRTERQNLAAKVAANPAPTDNTGGTGGGSSGGGEGGGEPAPQAGGRR